MYCGYAGVDPGIEEGEDTHRVGLVESCGAHSAQNIYIFFLCAHITHGVLGGSGGMLPQFSNSDHMRVLLRLKLSIGDYKL